MRSLPRTGSTSHQPLLRNKYNPILEGYLLKQGQYFKLWSRKYVVINHVGVFIYSSQSDSETKLPICKMMLNDVQLFLIELGNTKGKKKYCFKLKSKARRGYNCELLLATKLKEERDFWVTKILEGVGEALLDGCGDHTRNVRLLTVETNKTNPQHNTEVWQHKIHQCFCEGQATETQKEGHTPGLVPTINQVEVGNS